jgi:hypothetical protein
VNLPGRKTYMAALALMFLALGSVLQGLDQGTEIDWNRVIADFTTGAAILGASKNGPAPKKADA